MREHVAKGEVPQLEALFAEHDSATMIAARRDPDERFERNLARLLDGVGSNS